MKETPILTIYKPKYEELWFKEKLLSDKETMSFNHNYGGTISFPKEKWQEWYNRWMNNNERYYRYLKNENGNFVGEISYYKDKDKIICSIIIDAKERNKGYGTLGLHMLCDVAKSNGITEIYDNIAIDNPSVNIFYKEGFIEAFRNEEIIMVKKILDYKKEVNN